MDSRADAPDLAGQMADPDSLYHTVRRFIALRKRIPQFRADGDFEIVYAEKERYPFVFRRGRYVVAVNPSDREVSIDLSGSGDAVAAANGSALWEKDRLRMSAVSLMVFEQK